MPWTNSKRVVKQAKLRAAELTVTAHAESHENPGYLGRAPRDQHFDSFDIFSRIVALAQENKLWHVEHQFVSLANSDETVVIARFFYSCSF